MIVLRIRHGRWVYLLIDIYVNTVPKLIVVFSFLSYVVPTVYLVCCLRFNNHIWGKYGAGHSVITRTTGPLSVLGLKASVHDSKTSPCRGDKKVT